MRRFIVIIIRERDDADDASRSPIIIRWAIIGLAVLGVFALIIWRTWGVLA